MGSDSELLRACGRSVGCAERARPLSLNLRLKLRYSIDTARFKLAGSVRLNGPGGGQTRPATEPVADQRKLEGPIRCKRVRSLRGKFRFKLVTVASNADRHPRWHCGRRKTPSPQERPSAPAALEVMRRPRGSRAAAPGGQGWQDGATWLLPQ